jgi:hypothetical protein
MKILRFCKVTMRLEGWGAGMTMKDLCPLTWPFTPSHATVHSVIIPGSLSSLCLPFGLEHTILLLLQRTSG